MVFPLAYILLKPSPQNFCLGYSKSGQFLHHYLNLIYLFYNPTRYIHEDFVEKKHHKNQF